MDAVIDFDNSVNNDFLVVRQLTIHGQNGKRIRPDLILFVNGPPLDYLRLCLAFTTYHKLMESHGRICERSNVIVMMNEAQRGHRRSRRRLTKRSAFEQLQSFFQEFDDSAALEAEPSNVLRVYLGAIDQVLDFEQNVGEQKSWKRFRGMVKRLSTAFLLAVPREETQEITPH